MKTKTPTCCVVVALAAASTLAAAVCLGEAAVETVAYRRELAHKLVETKTTANIQRACSIYAELSRQGGDFRDACRAGACLWKRGDYSAAGQHFTACAGGAKAAGDKAEPEHQANFRANQAIADAYAQAAERIVAGDKVLALANADLAEAVSATAALRQDLDKAQKALAASRTEHADERVALQRQLEAARTHLAEQSVLVARHQSRARILAKANQDLRREVAVLLIKVAALEQGRLQDAARIAQLETQNRLLRERLAAHEKAMAAAPAQSIPLPRQ